ncbi:MAG: beta-lactamase family protein [Ignavibacteria bacterium]|nr:beta-lactamase family protein [Ignavibacteria bacterium]
MKEIDKILGAEIAGNKSPSVQYLIFKKDGIIYKYSGGLADIENKITVSEHSAYNLFSITKTFTALAVLQLQEQGKLDINEPASKYLQNFTYGKNITIKHLLNHSAGIPNPIPLSWIHTANRHDSFNRDEFFDKVMRKHNEADFSPNEEFSYSNLGYVLLGRIIEKVSGLQYEQYVEQNIIQKVGIGSDELSFTIVHPKQQTAGYIKKWSLLNILLGFFIDKSEFMSDSHGAWKPFNNYYVNGPYYGGLIGTSGALMKYLQSLMADNSVLLGNESKRLLFTENFTNDGEASGMCLSWFTGILNGVKYFSHAGGGGGYYCEIRLYPDAGTASMIIFNRTGISDERYLDKVDTYIINRKF